MARLCVWCKSAVPESSGDPKWCGKCFTPWRPRSATVRVCEWCNAEEDEGFIAAPPQPEGVPDILWPQHGWCDWRCKKYVRKRLDRLLEMECLEWEEEEKHKAEWHATIHSLQCAGTFLYPTFLTHFAKIVGHKPRLPLPLGCP